MWAFHKGMGAAEADALKRGDRLCCGAQIGTLKEQLYTLIIGLS